MRKIFSIVIGKLIVYIGVIINRGSSIPGKIALKINPNIVKEFTMPKIVIAVTGSSGKGSTSSMIASILRANGYSVGHNSKGSNLSAGIVTLLLENCNLLGHIKKDVLVAEVDERYTKFIFPYLHPNYVVITNITRDQPPRQGHFDLVFQEIKKALTEDMHLILNGDDPMLQRFNKDNKFMVTYYGINKNKYSYEFNKFMNLNISHCPICNSKLNYDYYHFEELGNYHCSKCYFKRPFITNACTKINYDNKTIAINNNADIHIPYNVLYCVYNTLASYTTTKLLGINELAIKEAINAISGNVNNFSDYNYQRRKVTVLNNKNENSSTFNQSLLFVDRTKELKTIVIGWKEISRRYNFDDLSWLYDIDFEILKAHKIDKIVCVGIHRYDIATRIKYAGIDEVKIKTFVNLNEAIPYVKKKTKGNIYAVLNFDYVIPFNSLMNGSDS